MHNARSGAPSNDGGPYYAEGCGKLWRYVMGCNTFGMCMNLQGTDVREILARQASFDLTCDVPGLTITELNADTFGASGCGRKASYLIACREGGCKAIQNTQSQ